MTEATTNYLEFQNACGIEVGDKVTLLRVPKSRELGWATISPIGCKNNVGKRGVVTRIEGKYGIRVDIEGGGNYLYPYFVLKLEEKARPKIKVEEGDIWIAQNGSKYIVAMSGYESPNPLYSLYGFPSMNRYENGTVLKTKEEIAENIRIRNLNFFARIEEIL